ncbi:nucleotide exchange factor GrpE [Alloscardovia omnicolens]|uniref:nucleotide exchange factor GrpE n=1 Tax=Alloscardovia omnicolens TaxID=419015 RepID=UPI00254C6038|nr:nucleotide exchange factor GrpE [Alloscardovia omnicolens]MDK6249551.1 nucleotide exchange factor GrpE [Alloscardovia omnicolens]
MSEFNTEDYVNGMDDVDKLANQEKAEQTDRTSPAEQVEETEKASEPSQENSREQSQDDQSQDASEDSLTPLGKAKAEAAEYLEALQRERAAFVNFRNRVSKEQDRYREHGVVDVLTALLPALDDIDRIRANSQMDDSFKAVATKIDKTFEKFGVEKFGEAGEDFDPTHHEGILRKPDADASHETVDTVVEAGYKIGDRVIRAARVVVAVPQDNE